MIFSFEGFKNLINLTFINLTYFLKIIIASLFILIFCSSWKLNASKIEKGYEALSIYDYFKARKIFYQHASSKNAYSHYGLALIYYRNNNPFYNLDSASKYAALCYNYYKIKPEPKTFFQFKIDSVSIPQLIDSIAKKHLQEIKSENSAAKLNSFLKQNYLASKKFIAEAIRLRDELDYNETLNVNNSTQTIEFVTTHPQSSLIANALALIDKQILLESTSNNSENSYINFIKKNPKNLFLNSAYEKLFSLYKSNSDLHGLNFFVSSYPSAPQLVEAWKLLFSLSVKSFSANELEKFLIEHPDFPFKNSILKELQLNNLTFYPYQKNDNFGFIDTSGILVIPTDYDAVTNFSDGLSLVSKNDSVFYINKENNNLFNQFFVDAYNFNNGKAAVKQNNKWHFINRQGEIVSGFFDEINELSDNVYTFKLNNKYGALNNYGQISIEPKFEELGNFKNGFAYYRYGDKYGFVSKDGYVHNAEFNWISDFDTDGIAIVKNNNAFGLINSSGKLILEPKFDQVLRASNSVFIVIKNNLYGFFDANGCFISDVVYNYFKEKPIEYYTNGKFFKLIKKDEQTIIDANGRVSIDLKKHDEISFANNGLIKVKIKNKFGFLNQKLSLIIPNKYGYASDFEDEIALVKLNDKFLMITTDGKEIFNSVSEIKKISRHYFITEGDSQQLINNKGEVVISNISNIQLVNKNLLIITTNNNTIKLIRD